MTKRRNPEALYEAAAGWRDMGSHLDGLVRELDRHVGSAAAADWHGPAGEAFAADWHRLKRSVDESLPVFTLAAADLETAAAAPSAGTAQDGASHDDTGDGAPPVDNSGGAQSSGRDMAYGFMALGQLANSLGGAFGKRGGGGGGQGQRPPTKGEWATSAAPTGPDPFGPGAVAERRPSGGAGIAKGVRTGDEATAAEPQAPKAGPAGAAGAVTADGKAAGSKAADGTAGGRTARTDGQAGDAAPTADGRPAPDVGRHGAFG
ncbi:WXG100 family type VII secretion target [Streptomyces pinistramenti]|uniref:WXG100 family type VII secretion target n=1 Tax=Streptomyces pinistramenti TaxID=2884812 RepID=UPI001D08DC30|nr:WXG100 family type VII secretion target [Streptomyces pinistramenti]MCB5909301.1 WXG100 family type VII secretion target [Streptomyces pinistramenti]